MTDMCLVTKAIHPIRNPNVARFRDRETSLHLSSRQFNQATKSKMNFISLYILYKQYEYFNTQYIYIFLIFVFDNQMIKVDYEVRIRKPQINSRKKNCNLINRGN